MATDSMSSRLGPSDPVVREILGVGTPTRPIVPPLPDGVRRARAAGRPWAIRIACLWDTIERYDAVRCRQDRLPAHHLVCVLARDVRQLADDDVVGAGTAWSAVATQLEAACADPLGDEPAEAIAHVIDLVTALDDDSN